MAISAATTSVDRILVSVDPRSVFENAKALLSSAVNIKQGDLVALDTTSHLLKTVTATTDAPNFLGIADVAISGGKAVGPYDGLTAVNAAQAIVALHGPVYGVIASLKLKAADAFVPGGKVYLADGQDSQTVSSVDPGTADPIGIFQDAAVASAVAGQTAGILIGQRYTAGALIA